MSELRRIQVTATREINEAWEREVTRAVELQGLASGQARVMQQLGPSVGAPALQAMNQLLTAGMPGWSQTDAGYRHDVEGGYVVYDPRRQTLEIVAECKDSVTVIGTHTRTISGLVNAVVSQVGEGVYDSQEWQGRTREKGEKQAQEDVQRKLDQERERLLREAAAKEENRSTAEIEAAAKQQAAERLAREQAERQKELEDEARNNLRQVGVRARQAFHRLLAESYRNAILAYAQANNATITCNDDQGDTIDIEFRLTV